MEFIVQKFKKNFHFIVCISVIYELLLLGHAAGVLHVFGLEAYGLLGSLLSIIHLGIHVADWGMTNSIAPYLQLFLQSKQNWKKLFFDYTLTPHLSIIILMAVGLVFFVKAMPLSLSPLMLCLILTLIILDTLLSFMRQFLYALPQTIFVSTTELGLLIARLTTLWGLHLGTSVTLSLELIIWSHLASTVLCLIIFSIKLFKTYQALPNSSQALPQGLGWRLFANRTNNYFLRLSRNIFTTHFLTPLFAIQFGLKTAGIFFFASKLAKIVQAAVKISIGYSGNGVLAHVKNQSLEIKRATFGMLGAQLFNLVIPALVLFVPLTAGAVQYGYVQSQTQQMIILSMLFLLVTFFEFFFMLYEQWYIMEEAAYKLFFVKIIELGGLFFIITFFPQSPTQFLVTVLFLRTAHFGFIVMHAYVTWKIKLLHSINLRTSAWYMAITSLSLYLLKN